MEIKMKSVSSGLLAGAFATACMSVVMVLSKNLGVQGEHPPKRIAQGVAKIMGKSPPRDPELSLLAGAAHLGFGVTSGLMFALARRHFAWKRPIVNGLMCGLGIWFLSYKGWVPAFGFMPSAEEDRPGRVATMIGAHVVYGVALGLGVKKLEGTQHT
jgi:hypothetical protein